MMNDETEQIEQRLRRQPVKKIPAEWRGEILRAASAEIRAADTASLSYRGWRAALANVFWPNLAAWGALAAVWFFIFILNLSMREPLPATVAKASPTMPETIVELKKQQRMFAELVGPREEPVVDRSKTYSPRPRGERINLLAG